MVWSYSWVTLLLSLEYQPRSTDQHDWRYYLKQIRVAPDSYSRNLGLFKAMWSGIEVKGWFLGMFP